MQLKGVAAAVVITIALSACALLASILFLWRRELLCFKKLRIDHNIANRTYDPSFSNKPDLQGDRVTHDSNYDEVDEHISGPCDDIVEEDQFATTDDVYAHPTFDYEVEDDGDENKQKSYIDMGASLPPQNDTSADEEYVYMGDDVSNKSDENEDEDMYSYIKP
ncbi:hypothetical protein KP79_PYT04600 [Mizuhopecten yessoensis]|uniref:Uncharacterized protein n=1 Tax=Mizuhopecten yessoensis TaxID=6573 RepID=A0A210QX51_MIZYE|nr:hypothetical protein KP79_PYT04600 [Mizuhopecten yessoensis]